MSKKITKGMALIPMILSAGALVGCAKSEDKVVADTVVYSNIYTSNANQDYVEAFAIKDGKYVYVGNKKDAEAYIKSGVTKVLDKSSGFVMSGATEGHGHYIAASVVKNKKLTCAATTFKDAADFAQQVVTRDTTSKVIFTQGWLNEEIKSVKETIDARSELDKICNDRPLILIDDTGHNIFMNSKTIEAAKLEEDPNWSIDGGNVSRDSSGRLLGLASDIAMNYVLNLVLKPAGVITNQDFADAVKDCSETLHANGYTAYLDAYTSYFGDCAYEGISAYDKEYGMDFYLTACYKIDPYEDIDTQVDHAAELMNKYTTKNFNPNNIKVFADGESFENQSAWVLTAYKNGSYGPQTWKNEAINKLVKRANSKGVSVHAHCSGDAASQQLVNAYIEAEPTAKEGVINSIGHACQVTTGTMELMAKHNIPSATNITWRIKPNFWADYVKANFDWDYFMKGYPVKSMLDKGVIMGSSTDYPANSGAPIDILNIMQIAVKGTVSESLIPADSYFTFDKNEFITLNQAMDVFTINGAKMLGIDKERGSIEVGKYADFVYLDKDLRTASNISDAKISEVYFEGNQSYIAK